MQININSKLFSTTNIIVALSLVVILLLVYLKNNSFELFAATSTSAQKITTKPITTKPSTTKPTTPKSMTTTSANTIPLLSNDVIQNSALVNFINRFIINKNQQNVYASTLSDRQNLINDLSEQVISLINPSS